MARVPAYPFIHLEQAVALTRELYEFAKRTSANLEAVLREKWGYSTTSSSAVKIVAALKYYGLVDTAPSEKGDTIKITERAYRILVDTPDSPERKQALKDAFISPKSYKLCWDKWGADMPPSMRSTLIFEEGFVETTVDAFLTNYRKSLDFSGLAEAASEDVKQPATLNPEGTSVQNGEGIKSSLAPTPAPTPAPAIKRVEKAFAFGYAVGEQPPKGAGMRQEIFALAEGDVTIQWPERISPESLEDFNDWIAILQRKIKRSVIVATPTPSTDEGPTEPDEEL